MRRKVLARCTAVIGLVSSILTAAEEAPPTEQPGLEEIVVTAQRHEETLQKAAIAIDAATGDSLTQHAITNPADLAKLVPALTINSGGGADQSIFIRGVGTRSNNSYLDTAVAMSYDGVFMGAPSAAAGVDFYDLERVEVLKGPQGILYGRNATGGAINVIPVKPKIAEFGGYAEAGVGNFGEWNAEGAINIPTSSASAIRLSAYRLKHDGYNLDGTNDADTTSGRAQFLIEPSDELSIRLGADYTKLGGVGAGSSYVGYYSKNSAGVYVFKPSGLPDDEGLNTSAANTYRESLLGAPAFGHLTAIQDPLYQDYQFVGVNAEVSWKTAIGTWTLLPAYRHMDGSSNMDMPGFNTGHLEDTNDQRSVELRLASLPGGAIDYIGGLYYLNFSSGSNDTYNQEYVLPIQHYTATTQSLAPFAQLTYHVTEQLRLLAGARYTHDHKSLDGDIDNFITYCGGAPPHNLVPPASIAAGCATPGTLPVYPTFGSTAQTVNWLVDNGWITQPGSLVSNGSQFMPLLNGKGTIQYVDNPVNVAGGFSHVTWKTSLQYDVAPQSLLYLTYETGYRAGGFQLAQGYTSFQPEYLNALSLGSKNRFFDERLQVNAEAFFWKYENQQINYFTLSPQNTLVNTTQNVGHSTSKGLDLDSELAATRLTKLTLRLNYLDATYDDLHFITAAPRDNIGCVYALTGTVVGGQPLKNFNCSGMPAIYSPKFTVNGGIDQTFPLGPLNLIASLYSKWQSSQWGSLEYIQHELIPSYSTTDAALMLQGADAKWSVTAYADNLEDKRRAINIAQSPLGTANTSFGPPLTYGVRAETRF